MALRGRALRSMAAANTVWMLFIGGLFTMTHQTRKRVFLIPFRVALLCHQTVSPVETKGQV